MERTNITVEAKLHELRDVAASWRSHANEWTMPLASYDMILSDLQKRCDRERKAAFDVLVAAKAMVEENDNGEVTDKTRYALAEKLYTYSCVMGSTDYSHAMDAFKYSSGTLMFKHTDEAYNGEVVTMTLKELLEYINEDRNSEWQDYNAEDWGEGMSEWTDLEIVKW